VDGDDGVGEIVLAAEHLLGLGRVDLLVERVKGAGQVGQHVFPAARPLEQHADVVGLRGQAGAELDVFGQPALPLQRLLRVGLVVPEVGRRDLLLELR
jgi:hypothetical protein